MPSFLMQKFLMGMSIIQIVLTFNRLFQESQYDMVFALFVIVSISPVVNGSYSQSVVEMAYILFDLSAGVQCNLPDLMRKIVLQKKYIVNTLKFQTPNKSENI